MLLCVHFGVGRREINRHPGLLLKSLNSQGLVYSPKPSDVSPSHFQKAKVPPPPPAPPIRGQTIVGTRCAWPFPKPRLPRWLPPPSRASQLGRGPGPGWARAVEAPLRSGAVRSLAPPPAAPQHGSRRPEGSRGRTRPARCGRSNRRGCVASVQSGPAATARRTHASAAPAEPARPR